MRFLKEFAMAATAALGFTGPSADEIKSKLKATAFLGGRLTDNADGSFTFQPPTGGEVWEFNQDGNLTGGTAVENGQVVSYGPEKFKPGLKAVLNTVKGQPKGPALS